MRLGVDYYPEHWERSLWEPDAAMMARCGVTVVRLAEFAWSRLEPEEGVFDFAWLDEAIAVLAAQGIDVVLGTPTACPPLWMFEKHPDIARASWDGARELPGIRGHRCYQSPAFLPYAERMVDRMAEHYRNNAAVIAWQIDNEVEGNFCCCDTCVNAFRTWLREKYGTLEALNRAWHTDVWSGTYTAWSQVRPPLTQYPMTQYNPGLVLDFQRYAAASTARYVHFQRDVIRRHIPKAPITTNTWFCAHMPDFYAMYDGLDFVSYDNYPGTTPSQGRYASHAFHLDMMRGIRRQHFWVMEQLSGMPGCWMPMGRTTFPGMLKGCALQAIAHGADTVVHFRWRSAVGGAEMYWHGLMDQSNVPGRRLREFAALGEAVRKLACLEGTTLHADVALLCSMDSAYGFQSQLQAEGLDYMEQLKAWHQTLTSLGVNVDVISQDADLTGYQVVIAPSLYVRSPGAVASLHTFAEQGGVVLLTCRSGVKDEYNACVMAPLPGDYSDMTGAVVAEYNVIGRTTQQVLMDGVRYDVQCWCDLLDPHDARVIATYADDFYAGTPAITSHGYGRGQVWYAGTCGGAPLRRALAVRLLTQAGIPFVRDLPEAVEITVREGRGHRYTMIFNNGDQPQTLLWQRQELTLSAFGMVIPELGAEEL